MPAVVHSEFTDRRTHRVVVDDGVVQALRAGRLPVRSELQHVPLAEPPACAGAGCGDGRPNRGLVPDPTAPFGGTKQSGIGREGGHEVMLDYLESKHVAVSW